MHPIDHAGRFFTVRGPLNVPRPVQGQPVILHRDVPAGDASRSAALGAAGELTLLLGPATGVGLIDVGTTVLGIVAVSPGTEAVRTALRAASETAARAGHQGGSARRVH